MNICLRKRSLYLLSVALLFGYHVLFDTIVSTEPAVVEYRGVQGSTHSYEIIV